jgi:hypothetical protein
MVIIHVFLKETFAFFCPLKGIDRPFKLRGKTRLIRSTVINWEAHEKNIKPFSVAFGFLGWLCPIKVTYWRYSVPGKSI